MAVMRSVSKSLFPLGPAPLTTDIAPTAYSLSDRKFTGVSSADPSIFLSRGSRSSGSGRIDHRQNMTAAAMQIAEKYRVWMRRQSLRRPNMFSIFGAVCRGWRHAGSRFCGWLWKECRGDAALGEGGAEPVGVVNPCRPKVAWLSAWRTASTRRPCSRSSAPRLRA
jgi:hypothetical protein